MRNSSSVCFARLQIHFGPWEIHVSWKTHGLRRGEYCIAKRDIGIIASKRRGIQTTVLASVILRISLTVLTSEKGSRTSFSIIGSRTLRDCESVTPRSKHRSVLRPATTRYRSYLTDALSLAPAGALRLVSLPIRRIVPRSHSHLKSGDNVLEHCRAL